MNYLQMAQKAREIIGITGSGPSSVNTTGPESVILALVNETWQDIQNYRENWKWMKSSITFSTSINTSVYTIIDIFTPNNRFKSWYPNTFYITINGQKQHLRYLDYDVYKYLYGNSTDKVIPSVFTLADNNNSFITTPASGVYAINADYKLSNQSLTLATDIPECHPDFHWAIVYGAVSKYALSIGMSALYQEYSKNYSAILGDLLRSQNPYKMVAIKGIA